MDLRAFRDRVRDWWRENAFRAGAESAYYLLAASAFLPLLTEPDFRAAAVALSGSVGGDLLAGVVEQARARGKRPAGEPDDEQLLRTVLDLAGRFDSVRQTLDEMVARAGAVTAAHQALQQQWDAFAAQLLADIEQRGGSPQVEQQLHIVVHGNVGAGAVVGSGSVHADIIVGGDYVQGDKIIGDKHVHLPAGDSQERERLHRAYLNGLFARYGKVSLAELLDETPREHVDLFDVYVRLFLSVNLWGEIKDGKLADWWVLATDETGERRPLPKEMPEAERRPKRFPGMDVDPAALEGIVARMHAFVAELAGRKDGVRDGERALWRLESEEAPALTPRLVVTGEPGSGKSTLMRHLALCLAESQLCPDEKGRGLARLGFWPHEAYTPVFVELRALALDAFPDPGDEVTLAGFLEHVRRACLEPHACAAYLPELEMQLQAGHAMLFLDGLDEVPDAERKERRQQVKQLVALLEAHYGKCRMLVTGRTYAYAGDWQLEGFGQARMAWLDQDRMEELAEKLFRVVPGPDTPEQDAKQFREQVEKVPEELRRNPLLFTLLAGLWINNRGEPPAQRLPLTRGAIYRECTELMLKRWTRKDLNDPEGRSLVDRVGISADELRTVLQNLAYAAHSRQEGRDRAAPFNSGLIDQVIRTTLPDVRGRHIDYDLLQHYLVQRAGLLHEFAPWQYRFAHLSFQEHLAAAYLARREHYPDRALTCLRENPAQWRVVFELLPEEVRRAEGDLWQLVEPILDPDVPAPPPTPDSPTWAAAAFAARVLIEELVGEQGRVARAMRDQARKWLAALLTVGALPPPDRAAAGRVLGRLGDDRPGVCDFDEAMWVTIPAGPFLMGNTKETDPEARNNEQPQHTVDIRYPYRISRYPVTNAQYEAFVKDGGYTEKWRACWTDAGWAWKGEREGPNNELPADYLLPNHPRVNVSWYEAYAFSRWLSAKLGYAVRLPTEAEWEKAARGPDGRRYPWGDAFDASRCNMEETGIGQTSAVGMFPLADGPWGADSPLDMSGNVWEWCLTKWRDNYSIEEDNNPEGDMLRVLRGGAFHHDEWYARCACRFGFHPLGVNGSPGFRVCAPSGLPL